MTKNTFFFAFMILFAGVTSAQEVRISGHQVIASDSTWTVNAGTTLVFGPNASVEVLGGLEFQGTEDMPILISSLNKKKQMILQDSLYPKSVYKKSQWNGIQMNCHQIHIQLAIIHWTH